MSITIISILYNMTFQLYNGHIILQIPWTKDGTGEKLISQAPQKYVQTAAEKMVVAGKPGCYEKLYYEMT